MSGETKLRMEFKFNDPLSRMGHVEAKTRALVQEKIGPGRKYKIVDVVLATNEDAINKATVMVVMEQEPKNLNEG